MKIGKIPWWMWAFTGGIGITAVILKLTEGGDEISPDTPMAPIPPADPNAPDFPAILVAQPAHYLASSAGMSFIQMRLAAAAEGISLPISTAWRSREWQAELYARWRAYVEGRGPWAPQAAKPGTSKHEVGTALDLTGVDPGNINFNPARRAWLDANAARYGWVNVGATFKNKEPWHWEWQG